MRILCIYLPIKLVAFYSNRTTLKRSVQGINIFLVSFTRDNAFTLVYAIAARNRTNIS